MRYTVENEYIKIEVAEKGAEVKSLILKETGEEYLWPGDEENWCRSSPLLFPIAGRLCSRCFYHKGQPYYLQYHGFARESFYNVDSIEKNKIVFTLTDTPERFEVYPFHFLLEVIYELPEGEKSLHVRWKVYNKSDEVMYFSIGGHPGFMVPHGDLEGCKVAFLNRRGEVLTHKPYIENLLGTEDGFLSDKAVTIPLKEGIVPVVENTDKYDEIVVRDDEIGGLALLDREERCHAKVTSDAPYWAIWRASTPGAKFLCLEPWFGMCDEEGFTGELKDKLAIQQIPVGECWENGYSIQL